MVTRRISTLAALLATGLAVACMDRADSPTEVTTSGAVHSMDHMAAITGTTLDPFTFRATLDPYRIQQLPDFMIHSKATSDIVIQRSVFAPGAGPWHTHPGPSFVYVIEGEIKLEKHNSTDGCTQTPVYRPGNAYFEVADEVHRAVVMSATPAVLMVTRFNIPVGGAITIPAANPGC